MTRVRCGNGALNTDTMKTNSTRRKIERCTLGQMDRVGTTRHPARPTYSTQMWFVSNISHQLRAFPQVNGHWHTSPEHGFFPSAARAKTKNIKPTLTLSNKRPRTAHLMNVAEFNHLVFFAVQPVLRSISKCHKTPWKPRGRFAILG